MVYFTEHCRFEITNILHRKLWDYRNSTIPVVLHRNTASKKKNQNCNIANPQAPLIPVKSPELTRLFYFFRESELKLWT